MWTLKIARIIITRGNTCRYVLNCKQIQSSPGGREPQPRTGSEHDAHLKLWLSGHDAHLVLWLSGHDAHLVLWLSGHDAHLVLWLSGHDAHLVLWLSGHDAHLVLWLSGQLKMWWHSERFLGMSAAINAVSKLPAAPNSPTKHSTFNNDLPQFIKMLNLKENTN